MLRTGLLASMVLGLIALSSQPLAAATQPIVGSWKFVLTPTSATPPPVASIAGLATFTSDGAVLETDAWEVAPKLGPATTSPVLFGTPGHGAWNLGPSLSNIAASVISLDINANASLHSTNAYLFLVTVSASGDEFSGTFSLNRTAANGQITTISGTVTAQRILTPALP